MRRLLHRVPHSSTGGASFTAKLMGQATISDEQSLPQTLKVVREAKERYRTDEPKNRVRVTVTVGAAALTVRDERSGAVLAHYAAANVRSGYLDEHEAEVCAVITRARPRGPSGEADPAEVDLRAPHAIVCVVFKCPHAAELVAAVQRMHHAGHPPMAHDEPISAPVAGHGSSVASSVSGPGGPGTDIKSSPPSADPDAFEANFGDAAPRPVAVAPAPASAISNADPWATAWSSDPPRRATAADFSLHDYVNLPAGYHFTAPPLSPTSSAAADADYVNLPASLARLGHADEKKDDFRHHDYVNVPRAGEAVSQPVSDSDHHDYVNVPRPRAQTQPLPLDPDYVNVPVPAPRLQHSATQPTFSSTNPFSFAVAQGTASVVAPAYPPAHHPHANPFNPFA